MLLNQASPPGSSAVISPGIWLMVWAMVAKGCEMPGAAWPCTATASTVPVAARLRNRPESALPPASGAWNRMSPAALARASREVDANA